jgi:FKBP-type peptidyl-prolyl cis-trans isomerase
MHMKFKGVHGIKGTMAGFALLAVALQGCLNSGNDVYDPSAYLDIDLEAIEDHIVANNIDVTFDTLNSIYYKVHREGEGYKGVRGAAVDVHYLGETLDGTEFVNTFTGSPERVFLGTKQSFPDSNPDSYAWGMDEWLFSKQREGDSLTIFLPSPFAFQDQGYGSVPANTPVKYVVKFVDIKLLSEDLAKIDNYISSKNWTATIEPSYGTRLVVHEPGDPDKNIEFGDFVYAHYEGSLLDETIFDTSYDRSPLTLTLGETSLIVGFELGLNELNEGDSATFFVPSIYGYGETGSPPDIPANAVLKFTMDIVTVTKQ